MDIDMGKSLETKNGDKAYYLADQLIEEEMQKEKVPRNP